MTFAQSGDDGFLVRLREIIEANLTNAQFGVTELASEIGMSRSNLHRKIKSRAGTSASKYICQVRLIKAVELLKQSSSTISEIAFDCGFRSVTYFSKCFHDFYGYPPGSVRKGELKGDNPDDLVQQRKTMRKEKKRIPLWLFISAILSLIAFFVFLVLFMPFTAKEHDLEEYTEQPIVKSIAVLPFINDSPGASDMTFINGTMEAILSNLGRIEALNVVSRTSVEQYRNNPKPIPTIAEELNVDYILEGSGQKYGDSIQLTVQLLDAKNDRHIWSEQIKREIISVKELFVLQSDIAQSVAAEIEVRITPEEKQQIEKIPTSNMIAYELNQMGNEEFWNYYLDQSNMSFLQKREDLYRYALEYDSTFTSPYTGIASNYLIKHWRDADRQEKYLDSVYKYVEAALFYDDQLARAYRIRAHYHRRKGDYSMAIEDFQRAIELEPNSFSTYEGLGWVYIYKNDYVGAIESFHKAAQFVRGPESPKILRILGFAYFSAGFKEKSAFYGKKALDMDGDSVSYINDLAQSELFISGNIERATELYERAYAKDSGNISTLSGLGTLNLGKGQYAKALIYTEKKIERLNDLGKFDQYSSMQTGSVYWLNGNQEKAEYYFNLQLEYQKLNPYEKNMHMQVAMVYAFLGKKEKAYENLRILNQQERANVFVIDNFQAYNNVYFKGIQDEPEFKKIRSELISKFQAEHERVGKWLDKNDLLNITYIAPTL